MVLAALLSGSAFFGAPSAVANGARFLGSLTVAPTSHPAAAMAATPSGNGYWIVTSSGQVHTFGDADHFGGAANRRISGRVADIAPTPTGRGYWLFGRDGAVYGFGDARWKGSRRGRVASEIVAGVASPSGYGYWLIGRRGGVFAFGDARRKGGPGSHGISAPIEGAVATRSGKGYWIVGRDGAVYNYGDAPFLGSRRGRPNNGTIVDIARTAAGDGYWLVSSNGSIYPFGRARFRGGMGNQLMLSPVVEIAAPSTGGYWFIAEEGAIYSASADGTFVADPNALSTKIQRMVGDLYFRVNAERSARGLSLLEWDPRLARLASDWSTWMGASQEFNHLDLAALFRDPAYSTRYRSLRENIYNGSGSWRTAGAAHLSLMNSDPHRKTILTPELTSMGVGVACLNGRLWVTEEFGVWLNLPAPAPRSTPPREPIVAGDMKGISC